MDNIKAECLLLGLVFIALAAAEPRWTGFRFRFANPCYYKRCPPYAECEVIKDYKAQCVCPKVCTKDFKPVCGTDWKTYSNECEMTRKSCEEESRLRIRYDGPCEAGSCGRTLWRNLRCPFSSRCEMNHGLPRCICPQETCSARYEPVCGSDHKTYRNTCEMEKASCKEKKVLFVWHEGHCRSDPCSRIDCCCGAQCEVNATNHARCVCNFACTLQYEPVCGSDGKTYGNACALRSAACEQQNPKLFAVSDGECPSITSPPTATTPPYANPCDVISCGGVCQVIDGKARCVPITDPTTPTTPSLCSEISCIYSECEVIDGKATCMCPSLCPTIVKPVCGSNGVTYENLCELKRDSCKKSQLITYYHYGPCVSETTSHPPVTTEALPDTTPTTYEHTTSPPTINPCATVKCGFYASCEVRNGSAVCVCPKICLHAYFPVCGSNGISYGNLCELQKASCEQQKHITVAKYGYCRDPILSCPTPRTCNVFCDEDKCNRRGKLCCCRGCGQVCTTPVKRYGRYMCPPIINECESDLSCSAGKKCCLDGCGKKCVTAVPTINTVMKKIHRLG